jgi:hypothetical protein
MSITTAVTTRAVSHRQNEVLQHNKSSRNFIIAPAPDLGNYAYRVVFRDKDGSAFSATFKWDRGSDTWFTENGQAKASVQLQEMISYMREHYKPQS